MRSHFLKIVPGILYRTSFHITPLKQVTSLISQRIYVPWDFTSYKPHLSSKITCMMRTHLYKKYVYQDNCSRSTDALRHNTLISSKNNRYINTRREININKYTIYTRLKYIRQLTSPPKKSFNPGK